jgi:hypothetical protein
VPASVLSVGDVTGAPLGTQRVGGFDRTVARASTNGNYAVVWTAPPHPSTLYGNGIFVRVYRSDNKPMTAPVHVPSTTFAGDFAPSIAMNTFGEFAVGWTHRYSSSDTDIVVQRFTANGTPTSQSVAAGSSRNETEPSVALGNGGDLMVAYTYEYAIGVPDGDIYVWTKRASGAASTFKLATSSKNEHAPSLALNASGSGVVAYEYDYSDGGLLSHPYHDIYAWRVTTGGSSGTPGAVGGRISVVTDGFHQWDPSVSINASNNFVVSYTDEGGPIYARAIQVFARRFDSSNNMVGGVSVGVPSDTRIEIWSSVSMDDNGRFIVAYTHEYSASDADVLAQVFNSDNSARGGAFFVSGGSSIEQTPTVALGVLDLTANYGGSGSMVGQAVFSFETYGLKKDASGNPLVCVAAARAYNL